MFGEIEDPSYSIFNAMTNLSAVARTESHILMMLQHKMQKCNKKVVEDFFGIHPELAKEAVQSPTTGIQIVKIDDMVQKF